MPRAFQRLAWCLAAALAIVGCASQGPAVTEPPAVRVSRLASTVITPDLIKFEAKVVIQNRSTSALELDRLDYAVDLMDRELFKDSFADLLRSKGRGSQTVTLPFQIAMKDILAQSVPILAEGRNPGGVPGHRVPPRLRARALQGGDPHSPAQDPGSHPFGRRRHAHQRRVPRPAAGAQHQRLRRDGQLGRDPHGHQPAALPDAVHRADHRAGARRQRDRDAADGEHARQER